MCLFGGGVRCLFKSVSIFVSVSVSELSVCNDEMKSESRIP